MPRANRLHVDGGVFHLTHRCHNQEFYLRFARDRNAYREKMREALGIFEVALLDYCLTCNHVHLLVDAEQKTEVSGFMQKIAGEFAREYNRRKQKTNAVWGDSFHATLVDTGLHLQRCQHYIELNMVRCGVVSHPREWRWGGYDEIMGLRRRYRLLDLERLCWRLEASSLAELQRNLEEGLRERIARQQFQREPYWTESLAVGSADFVGRIQPLMMSRRQLEVVQPCAETWVLKEPAIPYNALSGSKIEYKPQKPPFTSF